jgi:hypothetical protein
MSHSPVHESGAAAAGAELQWLPRSPFWRFVLLAGVAVSGALAFAAWLDPNLVFDFANVVFCG